jgi:hypothetical protein
MAVTRPIRVLPEFNIMIEMIRAEMTLRLGRRVDKKEAMEELLRRMRNNPAIYGQQHKEQFIKM